MDRLERKLSGAVFNASIPQPKCTEYSPPVHRFTLPAPEYRRSHVAVKFSFARRGICPPEVIHSFYDRRYTNGAGINLSVSGLSRDRSGKVIFQKFVAGNKGLPTPKVAQSRVSGSISSPGLRSNAAWRLNSTSKE